MRLLSLELGTFRRFVAPSRLDGLGPGLNLLALPNEAGKSTLLAALRAALFERHRGRNDEVRSFRPWSVEGAPEIALTFDGGAGEVGIGEGEIRLEKRFLQRPLARLAFPDGHRIEGDAAEAELARLLGMAAPGRAAGPDPEGIWRALLVGQVEGLVQPELSPDARQSLRSQLETEAGALLGTRSAQAVLDAVDRELGQHQTRHDPPRAKGRLLEVEQALRGAAQEAEALEERRQRLEADLERLQMQSRELAGLLEAERASEAPGRLAGLERTLATYDQAHAVVVEAELQRERARNEARLARAALERREARTAEREAARRARIQATRAHEQATERSLKAERDLEQGREWLEERLRARDEVDQRRRRFHELGVALEQLSAARRALGGLALELTFALEPGAEARVMVDDTPLAHPEIAKVTADPVTIAIEGLGQIEVRPAGAKRKELERAVEAARKTVRRHMRDLGLMMPRSTAARRAQLELGFGETALSNEPDPHLIEAEGERLREEQDQIEEQVRDARLAIEAASARAHLARADVEQARTTRAGADAAEAALLADDVAGAETEEQAAADLADRLELAERDLARAEAALLERQAARPALDRGEIGAAADRLRGEIQGRRQRIEALRMASETLAARISVEAGEGLEQRIEEVRRREVALGVEQARIARDVRMLVLLRQTLETALAEAEEAYLEPLRKRLAPLVARLLPDAVPALDQELGLRRLTRETEEPYARLSGGTREQLALLCRIGFATLLHEQGRPALLVLDDPLVFTDDNRLGTLLEILEETAERLQIVIFTCRSEPFARLAARPLRVVASDRPVIRW